MIVFILAYIIHTFVCMRTHFTQKQTRKSNSHVPFGEGIMNEARKPFHKVLLRKYKVFT